MKCDLQTLTLIYFHSDLGVYSEDKYVKIVKIFRRWDSKPNCTELRILRSPLNLNQACGLKKRPHRNWFKQRTFDRFPRTICHDRDRRIIQFAKHTTFIYK